MDKYEYKLRLEEIKSLNRKGRFQEAAQVADTIDWKKVRNISTLGIISDVYKINRRFDDARDILLLANEQSPQNRRILYALCDLTIKMGQVVEAVEYYKEYVQLAPNDNNKYILLYKIYEAQDISLEERIAVLREYKKREYNEKWAYELAFLYHRVGLATECVEECDQLILWFGEGKYVTKAMELKMLYVQLSPAQQQAYDRRYGGEQQAALQEQSIQESSAGLAEEGNAEVLAQVKAAMQPEGEEELEIHVKPMDMGQYNTINLQEALAESMKEVLEPAAGEKADSRSRRIVEGRFPAAQVQSAAVESPVVNGAAATEQPVSMGQPAVRRTAHAESGMRLVQPSLQQREAYSNPEYGGEDAEYLDDVKKVMQDSESWDVQATGPMDSAGNTDGSVYMEQKPDKTAAVRSKTQEAAQAAPFMQGIPAPGFEQTTIPVFPENDIVEKQITGQMSIEDVLAEWERLKKDNEAKRKKETKQWMLQQTGALFEDFDQISRDGILEKLQREEALPVENLPRDREEDLDMSVTIEPDTPDHKAITPVRKQAAPSPANAAARAVLAAQGVLEELPQPAEREDAIAEGESFATQQPPARKQIPERRMERVKTGKTAEVVRKLTSGDVPEPAPASVSASVSNRTESGPEYGERITEEAAVLTETEEVKELTPEESDKKAEVMTETAEKAAVQLQPEKLSEEQMEEHVRNMSREEKALFASFVPTRSAMRQLVRALDSVSLASPSGNMIITGPPGSDMMKLARNVIRRIRSIDEKFSGKIAKISGEVLNTREPAGVLEKIGGGALITENAGKLSEEGADNLAKALSREDIGAVVFLLDSKRAIGRLMDRSPLLATCFGARFDIAVMDSGTLVKYGCQYAYNQEYAIDELGRLALHTRIEDLQTSDHAVTVEEVRDIVDEAIEHSEKKSPRHFMDVLLRKRYDEEDMIILRERDFI